MKIKKKFYVAADRIMTEPGSLWCHETLQEAVDHAEKLLNNSPSNLDQKYIVKIVKVVRRKKMPVVVENVE